jgi:hypothetical protein
LHFQFKKVRYPAFPALIYDRITDQSSDILPKVKIMQQMAGQSVTPRQQHGQHALNAYYVIIERRTMVLKAA